MAGSQGMSELASAVVQVVTSGVDWPATAAAIAGGVVGVAGVVFAARTSSRTITAQDARAKLSAKRRIYANYLSVLTVTFNSALTVIRGKGLTGEERDEILLKWRDTKAAALSAAWEAKPVGSGAVGDLALDMFNLLPDASLDLDFDQWKRTHARLLAAMRADLGEAD
jgi:hypothetical protein